MMESISGRFRQQWQALAQTLQLDPALSGSLLNYLQDQYNASGRHYHTMRHIVAMLEGADRIEGEFADPTAAKLAIFFHDVIYDAARRDNEEQSAVVLQEKLGEVLPETILAQAQHAIRATAKHDATGNRDTDLLLDLDMAILGQPWAVYARYAEGTMKEYVPVHGEEAYRAGRPKLFIDPTLAKDKIFLTEPFQHLEAPARQNLARERTLLVENKSLSEGVGR